MENETLNLKLDKRAAGAQLCKEWVKWFPHVASVSPSVIKEGFPATPGTAHNPPLPFPELQT